MSEHGRQPFANRIKLHTPQFAVHCNVATYYPLLDGCTHPTELCQIFTDCSVYFASVNYVPFIRINENAYTSEFILSL